MQIEELHAQQQQLRETIASLESRNQHLQVGVFVIWLRILLLSCRSFQDTCVEKESVTRLDSKIRDLESRLQLEEIARQRADVSGKEILSVSLSKMHVHVHVHVHCAIVLVAASVSRQGAGGERV